MTRKILPWLVMASSISAFPLQAKTMTDYDVLVGSYTAGASEGIYRFGFNTNTGQLEATPRQVIKSENPSWLTLTKDQRHLFAVNENGPGQTDTVGKVSSFSIDPKTHAVSFINAIESKSEERQKHRPGRACHGWARKQCRRHGNGRSDPQIAQITQIFKATKK